MATLRTWWTSGIVWISYARRVLSLRVGVGAATLAAALAWFTSAPLLTRCVRSASVIVLASVLVALLRSPGLQKAAQRPIARRNFVTPALAIFGLMVVIVAVVSPSLLAYRAASAVAILACSVAAIGMKPSRMTILRSFALVVAAILTEVPAYAQAADPFMAAALRQADVSAAALAGPAPMTSYWARLADRPKTTSDERSCFMFIPTIDEPPLHLDEKSAQVAVYCASHAEMSVQRRSRVVADIVRFTNSQSKITMRDLLPWSTGTFSGDLLSTVVPDKKQLHGG